ncbi:MAG: leucine-rich repeat protein [Bacilli bacterium]|nr:leucine-rich repeat protein [Bacilli bacterium]
MVTFGANSNLRQLTSYAFWNIPNLKKLYLPDRLTSFTGGTAVVKGCPLLNEIWFPNTINVAIPLEAIQECPLLSKITLQSNFNVNANFGNCTSLTRESVISMFRALKDLSGSASKVISIHQVVYDRLEEEDIDIATDKNLG